MKKIIKKSISILMVLTLALSISIAKPKDVSAKITDAVINTAYTLTTTAESFYDVIEFTAPGTGEYAFSCEFVDEDATWDGYGYLFDSNVDVYSMIDESNSENSGGEEDPRLYDCLAKNDDFDDSNLPYIEYKLTEGEKYYFVLGGYDFDDYGSANVTINCLHSKTNVKDRTITSCDSGGYTGDIYCAVCDEFLEDGQIVEAHEPDNEIVNKVVANCYVDGYTGDTVCNICKTETKGTVDTVTHEYENNVCKHCGNIEYAEIGTTYTLETTEEVPYKVIGFKAPFNAEFEFYVDQYEDNYWDGYGYLYKDNAGLDDKIKAAIEDIPVNENNTRLSNPYLESDDSNGNMPVVTHKMAKDDVCYFVMGGYSDDNYGLFQITVNCAHSNTEVRNKTITSCTEGGYTGDIYCSDCEALISEGVDIVAGAEHNYSSELYAEEVCNAYAKYKYTCDTCGESYIEEDTESGYGDHNYITTGFIEPTCTKDGQTGASVCEHCGDVAYENTVIKSYHSQTDSEGYNPNYSYYENAKAQSCMVDGYTGDVVCKECNEIIEKGMNISATGHIFGEGICTECGVEENILPISADNYYEIDSVEDLVVFMLNSHRGIKGKLTKDIDTPDNFNPEYISACDANNSILDGGNHTLSNWNLDDTYYLFDTINNSTIKNLTVEVNMPEDNENRGAFGVIGIEANNSTFENITINGVIIDTYGSDYQGGIVGYAEKCKFINCTNNANIIAAGGSVGGIVGNGENLVFTNCINNGNIHADDGEVGGIAGQTYDSTFTNCKNKGKITTEDEQAGGIVGIAYEVTIDGCINDGDVQYVGQEKSQDEFGGIVGVAYDGSEIKNCVNNGNVGGTHENVEEAGGIAGQMYYGGKIINCVNNGKINAPNNRAGGIVGDHELDDYEGDEIILEITGCTNNGDVHSKKYAAGIIGEGINVVVKDCVNNGNITETDHVAGIIGYGEMAKIDNCYNTGKIGDGTGFGIANSEEDIVISNSEGNHTHKYDIQKVIKPATATTDGEAENLCKCGASNGKVVLKKTGSQGTTIEKPTTQVKKPAKTKIKSIKNIKTKKIKLTWKKIKDVKGYQIRYATNKKFKKAKIKTVKKNTTKVTLKKLKKKKYYIQVRAYRVVNGKKVVGKWSKRRSIKVKK